MNKPFFTEPTFPLMYQSFGLVYGIWMPESTNATKGWLVLDAGQVKIEAVLVGEAKEYVQSIPQTKLPHFFNVYPRTEAGKLWFQVPWMHPDSEQNQEQLTPNCDAFRIRGDIVNIDTANPSVAIQVSKNVPTGKQKSFSFEVNLFGSLEDAKPGEFWEVWAARKGTFLIIKEGQRIRRTEDGGLNAEEFSQPATLNLDFSEAIAQPLPIAKEIIEANLVFARPSEKEPTAMVMLPEKQVSEVFQMTVTGKIVTDMGAIYLMSLDGTSLRLSKNPNEPLPTGIQRWYVLPATDSTGQISGVRILGYEPATDEPDICSFTGRVIQIGKRNSQVLFKVSFVGQKDLKITLTEPLPQMKAGHLWRVSAKRKGDSLYIEHAEPLEAISANDASRRASFAIASTQSNSPVVAAPPPATVKRIVQQSKDARSRLKTTTANTAELPSLGLVEETFEETTARLLPIAQKALTETTNQTGWILSNPVQRGNLWEWEATLSKSDNGLGILARIQVNPYTEASKVIQFPNQIEERDVPPERLYAENDDDLEDDDSEAGSDSIAGTLRSRLIVTPLGAARGIGASCFRVEIGPYEIVLDAGTRPKGNNPLPAFEHLKNPNLILITHAHQDHIGALPVFYKRFPGTPMICTAGTREIAHVMLTDCLKVQQSNEDFEQLFDEFDLEQTLFRLQTAEVGKDFEPLPGLKVRFIHAGHILGAACVYLRYGERSLLYTGDYNTTNSRTTEGLRLADLPEADMLITESTYGADTHPSRKAQETELLQAVAEVIQAGGNVLIPAFALGRAQEILLAIRTSALFHSLKIPVYVDGLVRAVTDVFRDHIELLPTG
ncbi:MAG TPA: MBL fold metallo-hydrolase, partial [Candidatus Obscuribacterales bacterium]